MKIARSVTAGLFVLLGLSTGLVHTKRTEKTESFHEFNVRGLLPNVEELPGWEVDFRPIADTPELKARVDDLLNYDDVVFAVYNRGEARVSIYIAYWNAGKMPVKEVASHTPDVCWVEAGWVPEKVESIDMKFQSNGHILPTEHRIFSHSAQLEHVIFWHFVGDEVHSYGKSGRPPWNAVFTDVRKWGVQQRQRQLFVRISSNLPLRQFGSFSVVSTVMSRVPALLKPAPGAYLP